MPRTSFFGRDSLGPDEVSPAIPADSPRLHSNRKTAEEQDHDRIAARLESGPRDDTHQRWLIPGRVDKANGMITEPEVARIAKSVPAKQLERKGWKLLGPAISGRAPDAELDVVHTLDDGSTTTLRESLRQQLAFQARDANAPRRRIGRRVVEGEGAVPTFDGDDSPVAVPHGKRTTQADLDPRTRKPKP